MNIPSFSAQYALYLSTATYRAAVATVDSHNGVVASLHLSGCVAECGGENADDGCVQCCLCLRRGGKPWNCCF
jgi:hypothetical protein